MRNCGTEENNGCSLNWTNNIAQNRNDNQSRNSSIQSSISYLQNEPYHQSSFLYIQNEPYHQSSNSCFQSLGHNQCFNSPIQISGHDQSFNSTIRTSIFPNQSSTPLHQTSLNNQNLNFPNQSSNSHDENGNDPVQLPNSTELDNCTDLDWERNVDPITDEILNNLTQYHQIPPALVQRPFREILAELERNVKEVSYKIEDLVKKIDEQYVSWKRKQIRNGEECKLSNTDVFDNWQSQCDDIVKMARDTWTSSKSLIEKFPSEDDRKLLEKLGSKIAESTALLFKKTLLNLQEPPRVVKKNSNGFTSLPPVTLRSLVNNKLLENTQFAYAKAVFKAILIDETQANEFIKNQQSRIADTENELLEPVVINIGHFNNRNFTLNTLKMSKVDKRSHKRKNPKIGHSVVTESFRILFLVNFPNIDGNPITAWRISLPIQVIVHSNQNANAQGAAWWLNRFCLTDQLLLTDISKPVSWDNLAEALNAKFISETGGGLLDKDKSYLKNKFIKYNLLGDNEQVTFKNFVEKKLEDVEFSLWEWCDAIIELIKKNLKPLWNNAISDEQPQRLIYGFISREDTEKILLYQKVLGMFLLRFTDSEKGGLSLAYVKMNRDSRSLKVKHFVAYSSKELDKMSVPDRLRGNRGDGAHLTYLYPYYLSKDDAFGKFYSRDDGTSWPFKISHYTKRVNFC